MAQYLKSLITGVVLPYVEASLKSADIRKMSASECEEYEASMNVKRKLPLKQPKKVIKKKKVVAPVVEPEVGETLIGDFDPEVEGVLGALEVD